MPTLDFKGKPFVYSHHLSVPFRQLVIDADKSLPSEGSAPSLDDNLIIHGDNLEALKALLPRYAGKVDVIYIDPPYNTGNEGWAYNDNVNAPQLKEWLGKTVDAEDMERHDKWLSMMWPRLQLLKELLADDGVLLISIDENEFANLTAILNELFGVEGALSSFVWRRRIGSSMSADWVSTDHEYVVAFSKNPQTVAVLGDDRDMTKYSIPDGTGRFYASMPLTVGMTKAMRPNQWYELKHPTTGRGYWPPEGRIWGYYPPTMARKIEEKYIIWPDDYPDRKMTTPRLKSYPEDAKRDRKPTSTWLDKVGRTEEGTKLLRQIFDDSPFSYPKPLSLVRHLVGQFSAQDSTVLDSFAGSGTTAHAVLELNKADNGNRKFILIETEDYADTLTAERVRRVINGVPTAKDEMLKAGLGGSFTYSDLGEPMDLERFFGGEGTPPTFEQVADYVAYTATGKTLDKATGDDGFVGHAGGYRLHLIYQPDAVWMRGDDAKLDLTTAERIAEAAKADGAKPVLVFAAQKTMSQRWLTDLGITFCQLPYSIHRILGDGSEGVSGVDAA